MSLGWGDTIADNNDYNPNAYGFSNNYEEQPNDQYQNDMLSKTYLSKPQRKLGTKNQIRGQKKNVAAKQPNIQQILANHEKNKVLRHDRIDANKRQQGNALHTMFDQTERAYANKLAQQKQNVRAQTNKLNNQLELKNCEIKIAKSQQNGATQLAKAEAQVAKHEAMMRTAKADFARKHEELDFKLRREIQDLKSKLDHAKQEVNMVKQERSADVRDMKQKMQVEKVNAQLAAKETAARQIAAVKRQQQHRPVAQYRPTVTKQHRLIVGQRRRPAIPKYRPAVRKHHRPAIPKYRPAVRKQRHGHRGGHRRR